MEEDHFDLKGVGVSSFSGAPLRACIVLLMRLGRWVIAIHMLVVDTAAAAEDSPRPRTAARLVYERDASAESCPDAAALRAAVSKRIGFDPFDEAATRVISCRVEKSRQTLRAHIDVEDGAGESKTAREIVSKQDDCQELAEAVALALSIAINPLTLAAPTGPEPASAPRGPSRRRRHYPLPRRQWFRRR